jgi:hypothetical protein
MNSLHHLNQDNLSYINKEYQNRTYDELSSEFQKLLPSAIRASELIALMYNRLTLVENFSHKEAVTKIHDDHKHLAGFSNRNIRRSLPLDNLNVPRRIRPRWPKNSYTEVNEPPKLSNTTQEQDRNLNYDTDKNSTNFTKAVSSSAGLKQPYNSLKECSGCKELYIANLELKEALQKTNQLTTADKVVAAATDSFEYSYNKECEILDFEFYLLKQQILDHIGQPYVWIKDADLKVWFCGTIDRKNGCVISAKPGRLSELQIDHHTEGIG